ncbi:MAG: ABC-F family ATP-binding cassette domain-containing protein [Clostridia bacterium]|nr:ABC-F family ATP-binding cassette domain-containing protein [Clostridia bacterium]
MQISVRNGAVDLSGEPILTDINIEILPDSAIGIVGRNGCGKTTLLRLLSGELTLSPREDGAEGVFAVSGSPVIGTLDQMTFKDDSVTLVEELRSAYGELLSMQKRIGELQMLMEQSENDRVIAEYTDLLDRFTNMGGFYFEKEYEAAIKRFGFTEEEKHRPLHSFSGGQRTKIAFLKLLLSKPDLLLLDEPTNHLDIEAVAWLEEYLKNYKNAFVVVSHDRMFLDRTVKTVYEIEHGRTERYPGNYSEFINQKRQRRALAAKDYAAQQKEIEHLTGLVDRFRYKATKASMAQSKLKQLDRMERLSAPESEDNRTFHASLTPAVRSAKDVLTVSELTVGFDRPLSTLSFEVKRGDRVAILGGNGLGKSTLLKTLMGKMPPLSGEFRFGALVKCGYFDQQMAQYRGGQTVFDNFRMAFPDKNDFECRSALGAFMFSGEEVYKTLDMLSGGERVRLALCKLFATSPNVLLLDEPTNHMDIIGKETLEEILEGYEGTLIFVSHDRYFIKKLAEKLLVFENGTANWYEYGYEQYETAVRSRPEPVAEEKPKPQEKKGKKTYTTPLKERSRLEREQKKLETAIAELEESIAETEQQFISDKNASDYQKLAELQQTLETQNAQLEEKMTEWEKVCEKLLEI